MHIIKPLSEKLKFEYKLGETPITDFKVLINLGNLTMTSEERQSHLEKKASGDYFYKFLIELPENDFIEIINVKSVNPQFSELEYTIRFKNLERIPEGEAKMVHFFINRYFLKKNGYENGNENNTNYCHSLTQTVLLCNRGNAPEHSIRYRNTQHHLDINPVYKLQYEELMNNVALSLDNYNDFLRIYNSKKSSGLIVDIPLDPNKPEMNIGSGTGKIKDTFHTKHRGEIISINGDPYYGGVRNEISNEPPFQFKVEKRGSKYFLLARARQDVEYIEPFGFWNKIDNRTGEVEIDHNGVYGASFPNHTQTSNYQIDFFGTGKEPVEGWNTGRSSVKAGTEARPPVETPPAPEPEPLDPTSPILPADPENEPADPTNPLAPMEPKKPAPEEPSTPVLPIPKPNPKMPLVTNENQKKKPYDPTFLIVSGLFATAIIFGE